MRSRIYRIGLSATVIGVALLAAGSPAQDDPAVVPAPAVPVEPATPADDLETIPAEWAPPDITPELLIELGIAPEAAALEDPSLDDGLKFTFEGTPWRDVIKWVATEADLALHVGELPTGSFTYSDPNSFTPEEAIARINLFLLPQGFTLVRSGQLLSVINLGDPRSMQQLDALAELVDVDELDDYNNYEVVKCFFPLGEFEAQEAVEELSALKLMTTPAVFSRTNRLLITDTVARLKSVKSILEAFQPTTMEDGTVVKNFALQHVDAEDILVVARPHLGLATGEMIGIDVSLSADLQGKNIFVTGMEDKVAVIEGLVQALDVPQDDLSPTSGDAELRSHLVKGGNVQTVYNVLLTLLAGKPVRLSMDETAGSIVALASPDVQAEIAQTVAQLEASEAEFAVIQLKWVDPYFAISLLEQMLDLAEMKQRKAAGMEALQRHGNARILDVEMDVDVPKLDADPGNMRLYVRAKKSQIEQIKQMVAEFDISTGLGGLGDTGEAGDGIRLFPIRGKQALAMLETAAKFWRGDNPVILFPSPSVSATEDTERVVNGEPTVLEPRQPQDAAPPDATARFLSDNIQSQAPPIRCQVTTRGLWLQSEDTDALDRFYEHLGAIAGPADSLPSPPIVFYLRYTKAEDAIRMLAELLDGGESAKEAEAGTLVNGYVSGGSSDLFLGSIVTSREGTVTMMADSITVVADPRLNRLIAQGTADDIELIEGYLKIIDKDTSLTANEIYGTSHVIELVNTKASEVAAAIREAYAGRVSGGGGGPGQPGQPGAPDQAQREAFAAMAAMAAKAQEGKKDGNNRGPDGGRSSGGRSQGFEPAMTIAVHEPSNSLIVTAPDQLFREVEQLAKMIDSRNEQAVELIVPINSGAVRTMLEQGILGEAATGSRRSAPSSPPPASPPSPGTMWNKGR